MPTTSRSFDQPLVTPSMAFETSARVSPWIAACESFSRDATTNPSFVSSLIPEGIGCSTLPFGPSTTIRLPCTVYFTPLGNGIGFFPIRDISSILHGLRVPEASQPDLIVPLQPYDKSSVVSCQWLEAFTSTSNSIADN